MRRRAGFQSSFGMALLLLSLSGSPSGQTLADRIDSQEVEPRSSAEEIVERALIRAQWAQDQAFPARYTFQMLKLKENLDGDGAVERSERKLYQSVPVAGYVYRRLLEQDGRTLEDKELEKERSREKEFRLRLAQGKRTESEEDREFRFDRELVEKYDFLLEGQELLRGRTSNLLAFQPRLEDLPVRRRIDRALNKASGRMWIDVETFEVSRVQFESTEKIRIWWGFIGSISSLNGQVDRAPVASGVWFPSAFTLYMRGRIFFKSIHIRSKVWWSDFEPLSVAEQGAALLYQDRRDDMGSDAYAGINQNRMGL